MSWWGKLLNLASGGITGTFGLGMGNGKPKADPYAALLSRLDPLIKAQSDITTKAGTAGLENVGAARTDLDFVSNWFKNVLTGSDDNILKMFDVSSLTKNIDENEQQLSEQGVRGSRRAAGLGQGYFDRDAAINRALQQLRFAAPEQISTIASQIGQLGLGEIGASTGASNAASQDLFGIEGLRQKDKDRRTQLIASIFSAAGGAVGSFLGAK